MLPTSHIGPIKSLPAIAPEMLLARFEEFIHSANRLESSHRELQDEVIRLRRELEDRNQALERSLAEVSSTRQMFIRILETLPCGVVLLDTTGSKTILANPEAQKLLWVPGKTGDRLPEPLQQVVCRALSNAPAASPEEEVYVDSTEAARWLSVKATRITFSAKAPSTQHHLLIIQDISAEKSLERERERARNSIALAEMSSVLAHEIRNPLGAMELFLSLLRTQASLSIEALEWTDHLTAGVRNLASTVNNVLQFYASGALNISRITLEPVIEESTAFLTPVATEFGISLQCHSDFNNVEIDGDPQALRQVILNLCGNAIRHSAQGGSVLISLSHDDSKVRVEISDKGTGIAPEHLPHIFEAGFSASGRTSGLGLAVCKRIIEAHRGTLGVLCSSNHGTTMYLEIPSV
jgi:two-component system sensor histidine kinase FlrB